MKKLLLILLTILCIVCVVSCGDNDTDTSTDTNTDTDTNNHPQEANYKVTVLDADGAPLADCVVYFGDKMTFTDANGVALMTLIGDEFLIKVTDLAKNEYFIGENVTVTPDNNEITVKVSQSAEGLPYERVHDSGTPDDISDDRKAYLVSEAGTYYTLNISNEEIVFFLFTPKKDGIYEFSIDIEGEVGYYGAPLNALDHPIEPLADENGVVSIEIKKKNLGSDTTQATPYLIGIKAKNAEDKSCSFTINRASDPVYTPADDPYTYITNPAKLESLFISYKNWVITETDIDISKSNITLVYSEADKCYHLDSEDGPIVYVRLGSDSKYLPGFYKVCETSLMSSYIYDDEGNYLYKEAYNALINQYYELCDKETGLYPLDKLMEKAIKNHGNSVGWWNEKSPMYIFSGATINKDNAWLFACCTIEIDKNSAGNEDAPIEVEKSVSTNIVTEKVLPAGNSTLYFDYISGIDATLKLTKAEGVKVIYNGTEYESTNGKITVNLTSDVTSFQIVNTTENEMEISFTIE